MNDKRSSDNPDLIPTQLEIFEKLKLLWSPIKFCCTHRTVHMNLNISWYLKYKFQGEK